MMKRIISALLVLIISVQLFSCEGVYTPPTEPPTDPCPPHADADKSGVCDKCGAIVSLSPEDGGEDETGEPFTVTLKLDGEAFIPDADENVLVQWTDGFSYHSAKMEDGVAAVTGLDGDYRVTLSGLPSGYAYNPNVYVATNDNRNTEIEIYEIITARGTGADLYQNIIKLYYTGVYEAEIKRASQRLYYQFMHSESGTYTIESWVDVTQNSINPIADVYYGHAQYKNFAYSIDDGGVSSTYTKNFVYSFDVDSTNIGSIYAFGLKLTEISGRYPAKVHIAIKKDGEFVRPKTDYTMVIPTEQFEWTEEYSKSQYTYVEA